MLQHQTYRRKFTRPVILLLCLASLAACSNKSGQIKELQQKVWQNPQDAGAYLNLGKGYANQHRYAEAVDAYKQAIAIEPKLDEAYAALGAALFNQKKFADALPILKKRVELAPDDSLRHFDLGNVYLQLNQYDQAMASYRQAIDNSYSFQEAWYNLAICYIRTGKTEEAEKIHKWLQEKNNYLAVSLERHLHSDKPHGKQ